MSADWASRLVDFVFSLPDSYKVRNGFTKWILRKAVDHILPYTITWRTDKIGYEVPQNDWLSRIITNRTKQRVEGYLADNGMCCDNVSMWNYYMLNKIIS